MTNQQFLQILKQSFKEYLAIGTSRSPKKLVPLHGGIAKDLQQILGNEYIVKSIGTEDKKEGKVTGIYCDKKVDILILTKDEQHPVAAYAIKFVMSNYKQNGNNYFENMLGETANVRGKNIPYFQILILFDKIPYYENGGKLKNYETITNKILSKYISLSADDPEKYLHSPDKMLFTLLKLKETSHFTRVSNKQQYINYCLTVIDDDDSISYSCSVENEFDSLIIMNDYKTFIDKTVEIILKKK